jgi:SagB-type dehydrogenase family enzyme
VVELDGALLVEGGPQRHVFRGRAATEVLPRLLPLLDGGNDSAALAERLSLTRGQIEQVLGLLGERGLLEAAPASSPASAALGWFSRNLPEAGGYPCAEEILAALAETRVLIAGDAAVAQALARDLLDAGIGRAEVIGPDGRVPTEAVAGIEGERRVAVLIEACAWHAAEDIGNSHGTAAAQPSSLDEVTAWAASAAVPVLHVALGQGTCGSDEVEIGPVSLAAFSACTACVRRSRAEDTRRRAETAPAEAGAGAVCAHGVADLAAGLAAAEVIALAARLPSSTDPRLLTRVSCTDWTTETFWVAPYPDCDECGAWAAPAVTPADTDTGIASGTDTDEPLARDVLIDLYEWSVQDRPVPQSPGREIPPWEMRRIQELKKRRPQSPTSPRRGLPADVLPVSGWFGAEPVTEAADGPSTLDEALWATLLRQTAGVHSEEDGSAGSRRWTPCGGGLASVELYLLDERGFPGLPGTVFRYDDLAHHLVAVRDDHVRLAQLLHGTGLEGAGAATGDRSASGGRAAVVLVAAHARLSAKYRHFAYRLAHLDAGCASTQLTTVARAHGLEVEFATHWDAGVAEVLGLARDDEFVTAVAVLGHRATPRAQETDTPCR